MKKPKKKPKKKPEVQDVKKLAKFMQLKRFCDREMERPFSARSHVVASELSLATARIIQHIETR